MSDSVTIDTYFRNLQGSTESSFLESALSSKGILSRSDFLDWWKTRKTANQFEVRPIPFAELTEWRFESGSGNLIHRSGKFFRIEGISVRTNFGTTSTWMQPIINQPEIGILGFLTQKHDGILHFLVQAKMEPGNVNLLQLSPTVQATRSNYTQVHGGKRPRYLDYFLDRTRARVLVDQLQSEQGSRFLRKRNRNMIVEIAEHERIEIHNDFCWLTLGQLFDLLQVDNLVNMDSRTVLSCVRFASLCGKDFSTATLAGSQLSSARQAPGFAASVLNSATADESLACYDFDQLASWMTQLKTLFELEVSAVPLNRLAGWHLDDSAIRHDSGRYFSIIAVNVAATNREVSSWQQPLIQSSKGGIICFICQRKNGILHFLVQGRVEPGNFDAIEMAPSLQCTPANYSSDHPELLPPFYNLVLLTPAEQIRYDSLQSEEGGRFYQDQNRYMVIEIGPQESIELPANYIWMTLRQLKEFIRFNNYVNIEARGLISCLPVQNSSVIGT